MKKQYSLDYSIETDYERLNAVNQILNTLDKPPNSTDLEQMASYILYGKDENGLNSIQRGETTDSNRRYGSFLRMDDKVGSLDELLENPLTDQQSIKPFDTKNIYKRSVTKIHRPKYDKNGVMVDPGDSDVPGMVELWERIDYLERVQAANEGKIPFDDTMTVLQDNYRLYKLQHMIIDLRRHQYYLKDSVKPEIRFLNLQIPKRQTINWDSDSFYWMPIDQWREKVNNSFDPRISKKLQDYETRVTPSGTTEVKYVVRQQKFDWENPRHIRALIDNYSLLYMELYDDLYSWGRTLIADFDRYYNMIKLSPLHNFALIKRIDGLSHAQIVEAIEQEFGVKYQVTHISKILRDIIPNKIVNAVKKQQIIVDTPMEERKQCRDCKRYFPRNRLFFTLNNNYKDGYHGRCKECERKKRVERGSQTENDRRLKSPQMY